MAKPIARDAEDFARLFFQTVERLAQDGASVRASEAFERTVAEHPDHAYVGHLAAKPSRKIAFGRVAERLRAAEFPHIERRKATRRNAPVCYRVGRPTVALDLQLPFEAAANHPLVNQRRSVETQLDRGISARRVALTAPAPKSPWRRRLLARRTDAWLNLENATWPLRRWWQRLRVAIATFAAGVARR